MFTFIITGILAVFWFIVMIIFFVAKMANAKKELDTIPLEKMREALGIPEHAHQVIVNGKPVFFDSNGKEI